MSTDNKNPERSGENRAADETPEDVAVLYTWANLQGAKYRDFSASRREFRAQMKHRAAEAAREAEEKAKTEAEETVQREEESAARASAEAAHSDEATKAALLAEAARQAQKAAQDRLEVARHAEAAAAAEAAARRAEREAAEAHAHAQMQARRYEDQNRQERYVVPGEVSDPYIKPTHDIDVEHHIHKPHVSSAERAVALRQSSAIKAAVRVQPGFSSGVRKVLIVDPVPEKRSAGVTKYADVEERNLTDQPAPRRVGYHPDVPTGQREAYTQPSRSFIPAATPAPAKRVSEHRSAYMNESPAEPVRNFIPVPSAVAPQPRHSQVREVNIPPVHEDSRAFDPSSTSFVPVMPPVRQERVVLPVEPPPAAPAFRPAPAAKPAPAHVQRAEAKLPSVRPAWLYGEDRPQRPASAHEQAATAPVPDTLQHSRERVASRWFALKGVFDHSPHEQLEAQPVRKADYRVPTLAIFSLAGGVGKTSMVATLGRALSSLGEKVLLTDTTSHGLLPFYFGARELRPAVVRTFSPPPGSTDAPIYLVNYELDQRVSDQATQEWVMEEIARNTQGTHRLILDLNSSSGWLLRLLGRLSPTVVVPVAPDMNSVISLQSVEKFFHGIIDAEGRPIRPHYLLNQFDASLPLHLDVREVMRQLVGDRLLPITIRRNPAVSEALAEGMTVIDYAPSSPVAEDFINVATWVRAATAPATAGYRGARWSEQ